MRALIRRGVTAVVAGTATRLAARQIEPNREWRRENYRNREVDLRGGLAVLTGLLAAVGRTQVPGAALAVGAAGAAGLVDDLAGDASARGLKGHWDQLTQGRITTGMAKLGVISLGALWYAWSNSRSSQPGLRRWWQIGVDSVLVAGGANLVNLLDLRPGRALKAAAAPALVLAAGGAPGAELAAGVAAVCAADAPDDLGERTMLGDAGANALGAAVAVAATRSLSPGGRVLAAVGVTSLILTSEKVSFSRVIASHPVLRWLDQAGRVE